jgi:DNA-binding NarL/FixJ family response regulator
MSVIRVVVADDHELFRRGVIETLAAAEGFQLEGEAATASETLRLVRLLLPDLVLLDLGLPDRSGLDVIGEMHRDCPVSRIVVLTVNEDETALMRALEAGASAYILKGIAADELTRALVAVAAGEGYASPTLAAHLLRRMGAHDAPHEAVASLSQRERAVLEGIAHGATNREIAESLALSEKTVKYYVTNILVKLHVRNRVEAALVARDAREGLRAR